MTLRNCYFVTTLLTFVLVSCSDESPFFRSEQEAKKIIHDANAARDPFHYITNVVAIINNDIYYFARLDSIPKKLTSSPSLQKTHVKLSTDKTQIAYINTNGNPTIINTADGKLVTTLTQYNYVSQIDWAKDKNSLYFLIGQKVYSYGEPITIQQPMVTHPWDEIPSFSMNAKGDYGYFIRYYGNFYHTLKLISKAKAMDKELRNFEGDRYDYIDFYDNKGNFLLGYSEHSGEGFSRIVCVENYNLYAAYEWDYEQMNTPEFNSDLEILLYGTMEQQLYHIKAVYLGTEAYDRQGLYDVLSKTFTEYKSSSPIYLDWSH
jgi:hypothetical protein